MEPIDGPSRSKSRRAGPNRDCSVSRISRSVSGHEAEMIQRNLVSVTVNSPLRRREFILGLAMFANVGRSSAQSRARRVGALISEPFAGDILEASLKEKGWILGQNLQIEYRITRGDTNLSQTYARELLAWQPDVLFALSHTSMAALHAQRSNIPTVFSMVSDPVGMHYVESFSRPGGNVTGFTPFEPSLGGKWVSLIREVAPNVEHLGIVYNPEPGNNSSAFRKSIDQVANKVGITSIETPRGDSSDIERLIRSLKDESNSGLIFLPDAITGAHFSDGCGHWCPACS